MSSKKETPRRRPRILLGITGSVAAVKGPELAVRLARDLHMDVRVLLTEGGINFWQKAGDYDPEYWTELQQRTLQEEDPFTATVEEDAEEGTIIVHAAEDEWKDWKRMGDTVLHIGLRDWADLVLCAPLSAHSLAKIAQGLCDDTLSCVLRAWDFGHGGRMGKPVLLAPAMNTAMWQHPLTKIHIETICDFWNSDHKDSGVIIVFPQVKTLACGEVGNGALASVDEILEAVHRQISLSPSIHEVKLERLEYRCAPEPSPSFG